MPTPDRSTRRPIAGGALIALGAIGGAAVGFVLRQPTICFLVGAGAGIALSLAIWALDRRG